MNTEEDYYESSKPINTQVSINERMALALHFSGHQLQEVPCQQLLNRVNVQNPYRSYQISRQKIM